MSKNIEAARRALAALDVAEHIKAIADAAAEQQRLAEAIEDGRAQLSEISRQIRDATHNVHVDAKAAGDALLRGDEIPSVDVDALRAKQETIKAAMNDLRRREEAHGDIQRRERSDGIKHMAIAAEPLALEPRDLAAQAATMLGSAFAAAEAIRMATANGNASLLADQLRKITRLFIDCGFLPALPIAVPSDIIDALRAAEEPIKALRHSILTEVRPPL